MGILRNAKRRNVEDANIVSDYGVNKDSFYVLADEDLERILGGNLPSAIKKFLPCVKSPATISSSVKSSDTVSSSVKSSDTVSSSVKSSDTVSHAVKAARRAEWQKGNGFFRTDSSGRSYFEKADGTKIPVPESP